MKILHVITGLSRSAGGPARSSQGLVATLCKAGVDAWIYSFDNANPWILGVRKISGIAHFSQAVGRPLPHSCRIDEFDLVHIHGIWSWKLHRVAVMCRKAGVPYVIAPRGMLEPWSLKQKWIKKRIARWLYQDRDLKLAAALHATAESEAEQFRRLGFKNKIIVSPNGVNVPEREMFECSECSNVRMDGQRRALFVSRMHPKKGVLELVESWARIFKEKGKSKSEKVWTCELVYTMNSEEERAYEQKVKQRVHELGLDDQFVFTGSLDDEKKWEAYARADLFVLPTYSENFGIVVAEALWAGVPVITTKGTPWAELECSDSSKFKVQSSKLEERCGWWIDLSKSKSGGEVEQWSALDSALCEAFEHSSNSNIRTFLQDMGRRGHELVKSKYTWAAVVKAMVKGYERIV